LQPISKQEMDYLIERKIIILNKQGNYGDQLVVTSKFGSGRKKQRFTTPFSYNSMLISKRREKLDISKVKDNQKYLFVS